MLRDYWWLAFLYEGRIHIWRLSNVRNQQEANEKAMLKLGSGRLFYAFMNNNASETEAGKEARAWFVNNGAIAGNMAQEEVLNQSLRRASHIEKNIQ